MKFIPLILSSALLVVPVTTTMAQAQPAEVVQMFPALAGVNLSESQMAQMQSLRQQTRSQIEGVVSSQQRQAFFNALQSGQGREDAIAAANLSDSQRTRVRSILKGAREEGRQILTVSQRRQILQNVRSRLLGQ